MYLSNQVLIYSVLEQRVAVAGSGPFLDSLGQLRDLFGLLVALGWKNKTRVRRGPLAQAL
jgi:hypothetical protein